MDGDGTEAIAGKVEAWGREVAGLKCLLAETRASRDAIKSELAAVWEILRGIVENHGLKAGTMPEQIALDYYVNRAKRAMADPHYMAEAHDELVRQRMLETWQKAARAKAEKYREQGTIGYLSAAVALEEFAEQMRTHATGNGQAPS